MKHNRILGYVWYLVVYVHFQTSSLSHSLTRDVPLVIFLQPRPGPKLPEGESYLTIGWKRVRDTSFLFVS